MSRTGTVMTQLSNALRQDLAGRRLLLALTGGIACYKSAELLRLLVKAGAEVQVLMTEGATRFITPLTLQALSGRPVALDTWHDEAAGEGGDGMPHIRLTRNIDGILVAPASADAVAALAQGRADDLFSLTCLARPWGVADGAQGPCPLWLAPAMNREMWSHPATQRNLATVAADGAVLLGTGHGAQACGEYGDGRMLEPYEIFEDVVARLQPQVLRGRRVLLTAGPTFEALDPVRGLTNRSSGKMGFALARAAREAGADVTLVAGPVHLDTPRGVRRVDVQSARQMLEAVLQTLPGQDAFIATAAVADWRSADEQTAKIKKGAGGPPALALTENPDILATVASRPDAPLCIGFAAETEDLAAHARRKLERKKAALIVGNLGPSAFGRDDNALLLVDAQGERPLPEDGGRADKLTLARALMAELARRLEDVR